MSKNKTSQTLIDNEIYNNQSENWWGDNGFGAFIRYFDNPWRVPYFQRVLMQQFDSGFTGKSLLDVGCGGGLLAEEFAAMGFVVTGLDPSEKSLEVARSHAVQSGLKIDYSAGDGEKLPFGDATFDAVSCCAILEHIHNWSAVIGESARVLKPNGIFLYNTINRTKVSKFSHIKLVQQWKFTRCLPTDLHVWEMFVKPEELNTSLEEHGLQNKEIKGTKRAGILLPFLKNIRQYQTGRLSAAEFAKRICPQEGLNIKGSYIGYAIKSLIHANK
jgi:2-polyprenyl-6-hydroxyphenyl methylase/3-demethylubiquinone-9 3-methyltransferase